MTKICGTHLEYAECHNTEEETFPSLMLADVRSAWIEGANLSAISIHSGNCDCFFGSKDTKISWEQEEAKSEGLRIASWKFINSRSSNPRRGVNVPVETAENVLFAHWNPYTADDLGAGIFRSRFREKHQLSGWPSESP